MQRPELSILLPVYNGAKYLSNCIESVLHQDYPDFELIIGDDCSTDDSAAIIKRFDDPRIRYIRNERNLGLFSNLNKLLGEARAPIVKLLGQDDILETNCLSETSALFKKHPTIGIGFYRSIYIDETGMEVDRLLLNALPEIIDSKLALQLFVYYGNIAGNITNVCFRKSAVENLGGFSVSHGNPGDYEMWVRVAEQYPIGVIPKYLVRVRRHAQQLSRVGASPFNVVDAEELIRERLIQQLPKHQQRYVRRYVRMRQGVLQVHVAMHWLITGNHTYFFEMIKHIGGKNFLISSFFWLITLNNRLYQPKAIIEVEDLSVSLNLPRLRLITRTNGYDAFPAT
jgi:glycosyltransferase involved in cell wall biosynthesis